MLFDFDQFYSISNLNFFYETFFCDYHHCLSSNLSMFLKCWAMSITRFLLLVVEIITCTFHIHKWCHDFIFFLISKNRCMTYLTEFMSIQQKLPFKIKYWYRYVMEKFLFWPVQKLNQITKWCLSLMLY